MDKTLVETLCYNYKVLQDSAKSIDEHSTQFEIFDYCTDDDGNIYGSGTKIIKRFVDHVLIVITILVCQ